MSSLHNVSSLYLDCGMALWVCSFIQYSIFWNLCMQKQSTLIQMSEVLAQVFAVKFILGVIKTSCQSVLHLAINVLCHMSCKTSCWRWAHMRTVFFSRLSIVFIFLHCCHCFGSPFGELLLNVTRPAASAILKTCVCICQICRGIHVVIFLYKNVQVMPC